MTQPAPHTAPDAAAVALDVLHELLQDKKALRRYALEQMRWLTFKDVQTITGFGRDKLTLLVQDGTIPMFRAPGSNEWRITRTAWERTEHRLEKQGLLPRNRYMKAS